MMSQVWNPNYDFEFKEKINIVKGTTLVEYPYAEESRQQHHAGMLWDMKQEQSVTA